MTKQIPLTKGKFALVDDEDFERVSQHKWCYSNGYAVRGIALYDADGNRYTRLQLLHRFILNAPDELDVDHCNHRKLDCRRRNIRIATRSQNCANRRPHCNKISQYKGVLLSGNKKRWRAMISANGQQRHLGTFTSERDAALAYDRAAYEAWGEFAWLNFPDELATSA